MYVVEELYYPYSENKGADQFRGYREADLRLCFAYANIRFSHDAAQITAGFFKVSDEYFKVKQNLLKR